jgi:hypothetical protein
MIYGKIKIYFKGIKENKNEFSAFMFFTVLALLFYNFDGPTIQVIILSFFSGYFNCKFYYKIKLKRELR